MKGFLNRIEPIIWVLFGGGIMGGTILLTGWVLVVGLLMPLGVVDAAALDYDRAYGLASSLPGRGLLIAMIALPLWKGAHHCRHLSIDHGGADRDPVVALSLYTVAALGSIAGIVVVASL